VYDLINSGLHTEVTRTKVKICKAKNLKTEDNLHPKQYQATCRHQKYNISDHQKSYLTDNHGNERGRKLLKKKKDVVR